MYMRILDVSWKSIGHKSLCMFSCHEWMSHVTFEWGMSYMDEPCRIYQEKETWYASPCVFYRRHATVCYNLFTSLCLLSTGAISHSNSQFLIHSVDACCCSVLQSVSVWCRVLQCVAVCCSVSQCVYNSMRVIHRRHSALQQSVSAVAHFAVSRSSLEFVDARQLACDAPPPNRCGNSVWGLGHEFARVYHCWGARHTSTHTQWVSYMNSWIMSHVDRRVTFE